MSVPAFIDITDAQQTAKIRAYMYLKSLGVDIAEENIDDPSLKKGILQMAESRACTYLKSLCTRIAEDNLDGTSLEKDILLTTEILMRMRLESSGADIAEKSIGGTSLKKGILPVVDKAAGRAYMYLKSLDKGNHYRAERAYMYLKSLGADFAKENIDCTSLEKDIPQRRAERAYMYFKSLGADFAKENIDSTSLEKDILQMAESRTYVYLKSLGADIAKENIDGTSLEKEILQILSESRAYLNSLGVDIVEDNIEDTSLEKDNLQTAESRAYHNSLSADIAAEDIAGTSLEKDALQILSESRAYLNSLGADIAEENIGGTSLEKDILQVIDVCDICFRDASESAVESVFNGIVSLLVRPHVDPIENLILTFCDKLTKAPNTKLALVCLKVLSNLFHSLDECSPLRYDVFYNLIKVAGRTENIRGVDIEKMKQWMQRCNVTTEKLQKVLRLLLEVLLEYEQSELASKVMILLLETYTEDNASQARDDAHRCIVASLGDPNILLFNDLLTLKPVKLLEGELIHDLLTIFVSNKLSSYIQFYSARKEFVDSLGLNHEQNIEKMKFLTFMQIAEIKKAIQFEMLQQELQREPTEVELFFIDVLRTKMVRAMLDK